MKKKKYQIPITFGIHLIKEFSKSLIIFLLVIMCLIFVTNYVEELFFLRDLQVKQNLYFISFYYTFLKSPSIIVNLFNFVFLFASIHFFVKIIQNNEYISLKISGISNIFIILVPSFFAFFLGIIAILVFSPISSSMIKEYENEKKKISGNQNLIIVNDNGIWIKEKENDEISIIKINSISNVNGKIFLKQVNVYINDKNGKLLEVFNSKYAEIHKEHWLLKDLEYFNTIKNQKLKYPEYKFNTKININELNNIFSNTDTFSVWNINNYIKTLRPRGYFGDELIIKLHKYISLPFLIFSIVIFSTIFTINSKKHFSNFAYIFFGIVSGVVLYFLLDLSIALGRSDRIPLAFSVWAPIILILTFCLFNLVNNEN
jgi:lipopolysaccharide export system permease protein